MYVNAASGPAVGFSALLVFPILFFAPMCFVITELASAIPEAGAAHFRSTVHVGAHCLRAFA